MRPIARVLGTRLAETPQRLQILAGPRQVGKTTLIQQVLANRPGGSYYYVAADDPSRPEEAVYNSLPPHVAPIKSGVAPEADWLRESWELAERRASAWHESDHPAAKQLPFVLVFDEIQRVPQWSSDVKGLWDRARERGVRMHVVLLGSAPLLVQQGLNESLTGRYELVRVTHWPFAEMNDAFGFTLDQYVHFGGYPGGASLIHDEERWRAYIRDALVEPSIERDVLAMSRVDKPAMLRRLFELGCDYSGQIVSLVKVGRTLGEGHTLTLAHHLTLLGQAGLLAGLHKYAAQAIRQRNSPPKFQVHNNALITAGATYGFDDARADRSYWGRLVESAVGAHLVTSADADTRIHYWREADMEVDFVVEFRGKLAAIEVKSASGALRHRGLDEFCRRHPDTRRWLVGSEDLPLGEFLRQDALDWTR
ncbi:MAG: ATP-binding protein [Burkholderiales bacterium]